jgi:hypothetical protein
VDDAERLVVAHPEERDELIVAAQAQEGTGRRDPAEALRCSEDGGFHRVLCPP